MIFSTANYTRYRKALTIAVIMTALVGFDCSNPLQVSSQAQPSSDSDTNRPIKDKWAVVIGVSKFADPAIPQLKYPAKDAEDFSSFLTSSGHFAKDHVLLLKDNDATKVKILDAFGDGWLPRRVMKDDLVVIFISSHGSPADVAGENFVIAYDSDPDHTYATGIRLQDLANEVTKRTGCDRLIVLLDACHSGSAVVEQKGLHRSSTNFNVESVTGTGQLVICSSTPDEVSWESKRYPNGVFTRKLIESLRVNGESTTVSDAYKHLRDSVGQEVRFDRITSQTPMMMSKWQGQDLTFCAPPAEPRIITETESKLGSAFTSPNVFVTKAQTVTKSGTAANPQRPGKTSTVTKVTRTEVAPAAAAASAAVTSTTSTTSVKNSASGTSNQKDKTQMMTSSWTESPADVTLEATTTLLSDSDLAGLSPKELLLLYNEAYARHGRGFLSPQIQAHFDALPWYRIDPDYHFRPDDPKVVARRGVLDDTLIINEKRTPKQWANLMLIKRKMDKK